MRNFLTTPGRLARLFLGSRNAWKEKTKQSKYCIKKLRMRVRYWEQANRALREELRQARAEVEQLSRASECAQKKTRLCPAL